MLVLFTEAIHFLRHVLGLVSRPQGFKCWSRLLASNSPGHVLPIFHLFCLRGDRSGFVKMPHQKTMQRRITGKGKPVAQELKRFNHISRGRLPGNICVLSSPHMQHVCDAMWSYLFMLSHPGRSETEIEYSVGFDANGIISALDCKAWCLAGAFLDLAWNDLYGVMTGLDQVSLLNRLLHHQGWCVLSRLPCCFQAWSVCPYLECLLCCSQLHQCLHKAYTSVCS